MGVERLDEHVDALPRRRARREDGQLGGRHPGGAERRERSAELARRGLGLGLVGLVHDEQIGNIPMIPALRYCTESPDPGWTTKMS